MELKQPVAAIKLQRQHQCQMRLPKWPLLVVGIAAATTLMSCAGAKEVSEEEPKKSKTSIFQTSEVPDSAHFANSQTMVAQLKTGGFAWLGNFTLKLNGLLGLGNDAVAVVEVDIDNKNVTEFSMRLKEGVEIYFYSNGTSYWVSFSSCHEAEKAPDENHSRASEQGGNSERFGIFTVTELGDRDPPEESEPDEGAAIIRINGKKR